MITAPEVVTHYDNPYEWQGDVLIVVQQQINWLQSLSAVQCLQAVKVGQNSSQKTLRHFNSANVQVSQICCVKSITGLHWPKLTDNSQMFRQPCGCLHRL